MKIDHESIADGPNTSEQVSRRTFLNRAGAAAGVLAASALLPTVAAAQAAPSTSKLYATPWSVLA
jgi:anaerobic selenocysteine-containing dehydrogenase